MDFEGDGWRWWFSDAIPFEGKGTLYGVMNETIEDGPLGLFTTEHTETRFAGRGRQFEKSSFGFDTGNPSTLHGFRAWDRWMCGAKISNRLPRPAEPVSEPSVVKISPACGA